MRIIFRYMRIQSDKAIGSRMKKLREHRGVKQNFMAKKLGISPNYLCELEAGKRRWMASLLFQYEKLLSKP